MNFVKLATASGICLISTPEHSVENIGYETNVHIEADFSSDQIAWMAIFPTETFPLVRYMKPEDCYTTNGTRPYMVELQLKITELIRLNTRKFPCENGQAGSYCMANCIQRKINEKHSRNCRLPFMQESNKIQLCQTTEEYLEVKNATLTVFETFDQSDCDCPRECRATIYSINWMYILSADNPWINLYVYIPQKNFLIIEEVAAYNFRKLLLDIGGFLGLFFGFGMIQLVEMLGTSVKQLKNMMLRKG